jgi:hypothetical protein
MPVPVPCPSFRLLLRVEGLQQWQLQKPLHLEVHTIVLDFDQVLSCDSGVSREMSVVFVGYVVRADGRLPRWLCSSAYLAPWSLEVSFGSC